MNWYDNAIIYHIYPLGFCGAPKFNDGGEVVYRLDKVNKATGLDLRVFEDAITFEIALMVVKYMRFLEEKGEY